MFTFLIALIAGAMVVTMFTELDWNEPWWLTMLTIPLLMAVGSGLAWVLTCILFALAAPADKRERLDVLKRARRRRGPV